MSMSFLEFNLCVPKIVNMLKMTTRIRTLYSTCKLNQPALQCQSEVVDEQKPVYFLLLLTPQPRFRSQLKHTHTHAHRHTYTHTHTHTRIHTRTHTYTHLSSSQQTHTLIQGTTFQMNSNDCLICIADTHGVTRFDISVLIVDPFVPHIKPSDSLSTHTSSPISAKMISLQ